MTDMGRERKKDMLFGPRDVIIGVVAMLYRRFPLNKTGTSYMHEGVTVYTAGVTYTNIQSL